MNEHIESLAIWLNLAGISVFAASGALAAARKRLDFIAAWFFALVTATGGGTLRDLLIDVPVFWLFDPTPVVLCTIVAILVWAVPLRWWPDRTLEWLDAAGLAAYSVYGASKALHFGVSPIPAVAAGGDYSLHRRRYPGYYGGHTLGIGAERDLRHRVPACRDALRPSHNLRHRRTLVVDDRVCRRLFPACCRHSLAHGLAPASRALTRPGLSPLDRPAFAARMPDIRRSAATMDRSRRFPRAAPAAPIAAQTKLRPIGQLEPQ